MESVLNHRLREWLDTFCCFFYHRKCGLNTQITTFPCKRGIHVCVVIFARTLLCKILQVNQVEINSILNEIKNDSSDII